MNAPQPRPYALDTLDACKHQITILALEKARYKLSARILPLKLARAEKLLRQARKPEQDAEGGAEQS